MVQIKLSQALAFILAAVAVAPVVSLPVASQSVTPSSGLANSGDTDYAQLVPRDSNQQASSVQFRGDPDRASKEAAKRRAECQKIPICEMLESGPNM